MNPTQAGARAGMAGGVAGILGVLLLGTSFAINAGPPPGATAEQLAPFAATHFRTVLWGAWLQCVGPLLIVGFAITLAHLARAADRIAGWLTLLGAGILMMVSLSEVIFYISALDPNPGTMGLISNDIAHAIQHLYFIVAAPSLFFPLGWVILSSKVLPRTFGVLAIILGAAFLVLSVTSLYDAVLSNAVTSLAAVQALWWMGAAIALIVRSGSWKASRPHPAG